MTKPSVTYYEPIDSGKYSPKLVDIIINSIQERKGIDLVSLDLKKAEGAICDNFIICQGGSSTQVRAIADYVVEEAKNLLSTDPLSKEGFENMQWILLDYVDVVVHIFQAEARAYYNVEGLWADAEATYFNNEPRAV